MCGMGDVDIDGEGSGPGDCAKVIVRCSLKCTGWTGQYLDLGFCCDVCGSVRLRFWFMVRCGCHRLVTVWNQVQVPGLGLGFCVR